MLLLYHGENMVAIVRFYHFISTFHHRIVAFSSAVCYNYDINHERSVAMIRLPVFISETTIENDIPPYFSDGMLC